MLIQNFPGRHAAANVCSTRSTDAVLPEEFQKYAQIPDQPATLDPAEIAANRQTWLKTGPTHSALKHDLHTRPPASFFTIIQPDLRLWLLPIIFLAIFFLRPAGFMFSGWQALELCKAGLILPPGSRSGRSLRFTLWQAGAFHPGNPLVGLPAAVVFGRFNFPGKTAARAHHPAFHPANRSGRCRV